MSDQYTAPNAPATPTLSGNAVITDAMLESLRGTRIWVQIVGILFLIAAALSVLIPLGTIAGVGMRGAQNAALPFAGVIAMAVVYLLIALVYLFLGVYLLRYGGAIGRLLRDGQTQSMEEALQCQRKFWRLGGLLALISVVLALGGIVAAIVIPMLVSRSG